MNLQDQANNLIAQGALTNSKRPSTFVEGVYPTHVDRGRGCYLWDYQGKKYFDFIGGLGCNILGYAQEDVNFAMIERMHKGVTLSLSTEEELKLAAKIQMIFPFVDCMKFLKTGSEACSAAVRIARAYTGKENIVSAGFHGWNDEFVSLTSPAIGVPNSYDRFMYKFDEKSFFKNDFGGNAAVIIEPIVTDISDERIHYLKYLREECTKQGVLLIFDEIVTGFRFPKFSVANYLGIEPDLILLGKALANGMPISVVAGKKEIMNCGEYFVSSTFAGETLSIVAACKTIDLLRSKFSLAELWRKGEEWLAEFNELWPEKIRIAGYPTRGRFEGDPMTIALFFQSAVDSGMLFGPSWFFNFPLAEKSQITLTAAKDIICKLKAGGVTLRGQVPRSPFAEKMRR